MKNYIVALLSFLVLGICTISVGFSKPFEKQKYIKIEKTSVYSLILAEGDGLDPGGNLFSEFEYIEINYAFIGRQAGETPYCSSLVLNNKPKGNYNYRLHVCRSNC